MATVIPINRGMEIYQDTDPSWWRGEGSILNANIKEHVETPSSGQIYAGGVIADGSPWTIAARSIGFTPSATTRYIFDSQDGRIILGISSATDYGFFNGSVWTDVPIFPDTNEHIWFLICDGANAQAYLDNVATGSSFACALGLQVSGTTRWRRSFDNVGSSAWGNNLTRAAVYNIALSADQRSALYTSMLT